MASIGEDDSKNEKRSLPLDPVQQSSDPDIVATRAIAFPDDQEKERPTGGLRPKGVEMKRTITQEDRDLAAAGYAELEDKKHKAGGKEVDLMNVDIQEHRLAFEKLKVELETSFDSKDPGASTGLTSEEAKVRLQKNGPNVLTPPKKRSALRKVRELSYPSSSISYYAVSVHR